MTMIDPEIQNNIGKEVIAGLGSLPNYGAILWWNGSESHSIDGATAEWAIDVHTIDRNDPDHRYDPNGTRNYPKITKGKNKATEELGLKGILGVLVVLDYRNDTAEIHVKEMPLKPHWFNEAIQQGAYSWRKYNAPKVLEKVKFNNPFKDWRRQEPNTK